MANQLPPEFGQVPIVGVPVQAFEAFVMATFVCKCRPNNTPALLRGVDAMIGCKHCFNVYGITQAFYDRAQGQLSVVVDVIGRAAPRPEPDLVGQSLAPGN